MTDTTDLKQTFTNLASSAQSGQLIIEEGTAQKCISRCNSYLIDLNALISDAQVAVHSSAFGNLKSAGKFIEKFHNLSTDDSQGSGGYIAVVKEHIAVVNQMVDMFTKAEQAYKSSDEETKAKIQQTMNSLGNK